LAKKLDKDTIQRDAFVSALMVGDCPMCGSSNTHDCEAVTFECGATEPQRILKSGSDCEVAKKLDDPTIGHCDDCGYLWCLECNSEVSLETPLCAHYAICEDCGKEECSQPAFECSKVKKWKKQTTAKTKDFKA